MRILLPIVVILFGLFIVIAAPALAQSPEPNYDRINDIAENLNCPTCTGINLADCRTLTCEQWRDKINELVDEGYSNQEVLDYFSTQYGTQVLQEPPRSGFTLILWVLPVIALVVGGAWLVYTMRGWSRPEPAPATAEPVSTGVASSSPDSVPADDYLSQVEHDLGLE
jgi:cytochrome c-type biogenesis protein CcmH